MAVGLKHGRRDASERDARAYALTQEICQGFRAEMGDLHCRALTGMDLSTREGVKSFYASEVPARVCMTAVGVAYRLAMGLLAER